MVSSQQGHQAPPTVGKPNENTLKVVFKPGSDKPSMIIELSRSHSESAGLAGQYSAKPINLKPASIGTILLKHFQYYWSNF